jgi:RNA polymerase sigma factor (sigma-70 family)
MTQPEGTVFILDDDTDVREAIQELLRSVRLGAEAFATPSEFLQNSDPERPGCLLLDMRLPGMSGLRVQDELITRGIDLPIIFMTGYADLTAAVEAMKKGAYDFMEKPLGDQALLDRVNAALREDQRRRQHRMRMAALHQKLTLLTAREREVLDLLRAGKTTNAVARALGISQKTVQVHRSRILETLEVQSSLELVVLLHTWDHAPAQHPVLAHA